MNSSKVKTQKNISAFIALVLAFATLLQAGTIKSNEEKTNLVSIQEAEVLMDIEQMLLEEDEEYEETFTMEEAEINVKVFNADNQLIREGDLKSDEELSRLVNRADLLTEVSGYKYYRISE